MDPKSMTIVDGDVTEQTKQVFKNFDQVVQASGSTRNKVAKTTVRIHYPQQSQWLITHTQVFLKSMDNFAEMNAVYSEYFGEHKPARSAVEVARLPRDVLVEIEAIVVE